MEKVRKQARLWLCISLALILLCGIVVSTVQTDGGKVVMKELNLEADAGYSMSAYLFIPPNATAETPAPGIVTSHGYLNNKEMQDANYVELARRGYVVLAIDQPSHGDSEILVSKSNFMIPTGVYNGALALSRMPFVDVNKIGITGHSMGGMSCNAAIAQDNAAVEAGLYEKPVIAAVLLNCADATYTDASGAFTDVYGSRDAGRYIRILAPLVPFMYTDMSVDGCLKGLGQQVWSMGINIVDALLGLLLTWQLLPRYALAAYIGIIYATELLNFVLSAGRLWKVTRTL